MKPVLVAQNNASNNIKLVFFFSFEYLW